VSIHACADATAIKHAYILLQLREEVRQLSACSLLVLLQRYILLDPLDYAHHYQSYEAQPDHAHPNGVRDSAICMPVERTSGG
jgi:hypothetical protein